VHGARCTATTSLRHEGFFAPFTVRREYCDLSENPLPFNRFPQIFIDKFSKEVI
jgi:hypothetical protein